MKLISASVIGTKIDFLRSGQCLQSMTIRKFPASMSQFNARLANLYHKRAMTKKDVMERVSNRADRFRPKVAPVFLVLERDPLIAEDIRGSLKDIGPCRVIHASDAGSVASLLRGEDRISAAFLGICFRKVLDHGLDRCLNAHGARIILTVGEDDQAQALARGWGMLIRPFTDDMIRALVLAQPLR